ncbi:NCS1 family nucleobase:cation symporter-1 [Paraburkholderia caballeronis]|uniref:Nucleobase:cation symporter-1, NCS1 family n=1 Tax=Paraburkholderia caballeronis TaxID=416943 RepID=A0A1H7QNY5_9BURK|nr:NCS1 family nucleobase:cation symporter-1 [Paraburkholderia caballeronis]PXW22445.1 NCS1 family nucleobase:cation symporter-1 [Paraburkholderia caballeronis]PXW96316.1 NCS1 family nucleobase:cation symporter-1 [Paraburkholderia caballeronis]RAJ92727.1 NCS1 family nucleobase:cation symporter-1 [Paraburkholderia caballeronis]TDV15114.1 NCS1 family nucleobase:cation symporter-1 [Paraburkholderia caballeronis]TDV16761.1 NCS1 family nucleobase:cation symporter-1 [Paraburkholderia caballeronis]
MSQPAMTGDTAARHSDSDLYNDDLAPTGVAQRTWRWYHFAALWVGMVMNIASYMLAAGLTEQGMSPWQAVATVLLGNLIVLVPMLLIGHAGAKHGIPYAVLVRSSFGTQGAKLPALLRAIVACGWYGIQTWLGGSAIYTLANILTGNALVGEALPVIGISVGQAACFLVFWALQLYFIVRGTDSIRWLESWSAPIKVVMCAALVWWAYSRAGGFGAMLSQPSQFVAGGKKAGLFWATFWPGLTAMVGFWATLALNIPDFTRFAKTQRDQMIGQAIGLPIPMAMLSVVSVVVTSATVVIYGRAIWDPIDLTSRMEGIGVGTALVILTLDTMCCNLAANLVGPAYDFSSLWPKGISYKVGGIITATIAIVMMPWKILATTQGYIFTWLVGYSALLGPVAGIMMVDYFLVRATRLDTTQLFDENGEYAYVNGWNPAAVVALIAGVLPNLPGFLNVAFPTAFPSVPDAFKGLYTYAWFVGLAIAALVYGVLMKLGKSRSPSIASA